MDYKTYIQQKAYPELRYNSAECTNYNSCVGADETATGGGSGSGSGGTAGAPGIDAGLMGFPGFNF